MQRIKHEGISCWTDSLRVSSNDRYSTSLVFLSLFGPRNAVRALWARLFDERSGGLVLDDSPAEYRCGYYLMKGVKYISLSAPLGKQTLHQVVIHPEATHQVSPFLGHFYQVGPSPEERYFARLNRACPVPFRSSWREPLWRLGLQAGLIQALGGFGLPGYRVDTTDAWAGVVKSAIEKGELD